MALLLDATEMLHDLMVKHFQSRVNLKDLFSQTFLDRLKWVSDHFGADVRATVDIHKGKNQKMSQDEIDQLLKKLRFGLID